MEGTGAYRAGLARHLHEQGIKVSEVPRPDRRLRQRGKSDPIDAEAAARTVLGRSSQRSPKLATGPIEAIRMLRIARAGAVKAKTAATNALHALVITAPEAISTQLKPLSSSDLITTCLRLRPDLDHLNDPTQAAKLALRSLAGQLSTPVKSRPGGSGWILTHLWLVVGVGRGWAAEVSVFGAVAVAFEGDDVGVVDESVDHGGGDDVVAEDFSPAAEWFVAGDDQGRSFVAVGHELEEQVRGFGLEGDVADFVDDQEWVAAEAEQFLLESSGVVGVGEAGDPFGGGGEQGPGGRSRTLPGIFGPGTGRL